MSGFFFAKVIPSAILFPPSFPIGVGAKNFPGKLHEIYVLPLLA
jgi:hypothetical protein